jgi:hypothetical protein
MDEQVAGEPDPNAAPPLYIVSGGEGVVGAEVARLVLAQFDGVRVPLIVVPNVGEPGQLADVVARAAASGGTILHTLMETALRRELVRKARASQVAEIDLVGAILARVATVVGKEPLGKAGLYRKRRAAYFERLEAIDYSIQHDDGAHTNDLDRPRSCLSGSRVSARRR